MMDMIRRWLRPNPPVAPAPSPEEKFRARFEDFYSGLSPEVAALVGDKQANWECFCALERMGPEWARIKLNDPHNKTDYIEVPVPSLH